MACSGKHFDAVHIAKAEYPLSADPESVCLFKCADIFNHAFSIVLAHRYNDLVGCTANAPGLKNMELGASNDT